MHHIELLEKFASLIDKVNKISNDIKTLTNPQGAEIRKKGDLWSVILPPREEGDSKIIEVRIVSNIDSFVTDKNKVIDFVGQLEDIKAEMEKIVDELEEMDAPYVEGLKDIVEKYF